MNYVLSLCVICTAILSGCLFEEPYDSLSSVSDHLGFSLSERKSINVVKEKCDIYIEDTAGLPETGGNPRKKVLDFEYTVMQIARIHPVRVGTDSVQASDIVIDGETAVIAYNCDAGKFAGALQVVDIAESDSPVIVQEIVSDHADINALYTNGNEMVFGGAVDPEVCNYRSFVSILDADGIDMDGIYARKLITPSYTVTGMHGHGSQWFASTGATGGAVVIIDKDFTRLDTIELPDARDVAAYEGGFCAVFGTTNTGSGLGGVSVYDPAGGLRYSRKIHDFGSGNHKATIEIVYGAYAALGLSEAGCKVLDLQDGSFVWETGNPITANSAILTNTNSVSADGRLLFTANGRFGFQIFRIADEKFTSVERVGFVPFDGLKAGKEYCSANHVAFKGNHLFVASGAGGVNVYTFIPK